jgi:hypothetical protein
MTTTITNPIQAHGDPTGRRCGRSLQASRSFGQDVKGRLQFARALIHGDEEPTMYVLLNEASMWSGVSARSQDEARPAAISEPASAPTAIGTRGHSTRTSVAMSGRAASGGTVTLTGGR